MIWMCTHCLEEGDWPDDVEDMCPDCKQKGHVHPWRPSQCPACNKEFFDRMEELKRQIDARHFMNGLFKEFNPVHQVLAGDTLLADIANHCARWDYYKSPGSDCTSAHEGTHGINNDIRNSAGNFTSLDMLCEEKGTLRKPSWCLSTQYPNSNARVNGFYVGENRSIVIAEPKTRKRDCQAFIPSSFHKMRYGLYVQGQTEWDDSPLYLFDEWVAYSNGAHCGVDLAKRNQFKEKGTGVIDGTVEFIAYGLATAMAADKAGDLSEPLKAFTAFMVRRSTNAFFMGQELGLLGFGEAELMAALRADPAYTGFLVDKLGMVLPAAVVPEEGGPLDKNSFLLI